MADESQGNLLPSRSIVERHFYLMVLACEKCGKGPFELVSTERTPEQNVDIWFTRCKKCRQGRRLQFNRSELMIDEAATASHPLPEVNPTDQPSRLIDLGQWLALFYSILSAAAEQSDRKEAQRLGYEATLCIEEALKFYHPDSDLPPADALWVESSKQRLQERPETFVRQKLIHMREKLPSLQVMRQSITDPKTKKAITDLAPDAPAPKPSWFRRWFGKKS